MSDLLEKTKTNLDKIADKLDGGQADNNRSLMDRIADAVDAGSGGGSGSGGVLYLTTTIGDEMAILSASYNDILAAVNQNKVVILKYQSDIGVEFYLLRTLEYTSEPLEYSAAFSNTLYFIAQLPTELLVLYNNGDGGDEES